MRTVKFDGKDSYSHFGLIRSGAEIGTPEVRKSTVEEEGMDGVLDFTEYFGEPIYENREINFEFQVPPQEPWENIMAITDIPTESEFIDGGKGGITVYGNTRQNLWVNPNSQTMNGITTTPNDDGTVSFSGTATQNMSSYSDNSYVLKPGATYTASVDRKIADDYSLSDNTGACFVLTFYGSDNTYLTDRIFGYGSLLVTSITIPEGAKFVKFGVVIKEDQAVSGTYRVMLNEGSEAHPWCPPGIRGVEELELVTSGKNFWPGENQSIATRSKTINLRQGDTYVISLLSLRNWWSGENVNYWFLHDANSRISIAKLAFPSPAIGERTQCNPFSVQKDGEYFIAFYNEVGYSFDDIQLERGTQATAYEPPNITQTPIDLQGHTLHSLPDGTRDELHVDSSGAVTLVKRVGKAFVDGANYPFTNFDGTTPAKYAFRSGFDVAASIGTTGYKNILCDALPPGDYGNVENRVSMYSGSACASVGTDLASANEWAKVRPITWYYELATEQTIELGSIEMEQFDRSFHALFSKLKNAIHGKKCKIELSDDPAFYYTGRCEVDEWQTNERIGSIAVTCDCEPYKARQHPTEVSVELMGSAKTVTFRNLRKRVVPVFDTGGASITIKQGTKTFTAQGSSWSSADLMFVQGENQLTFTGTGTVKVSYQERGL